jgi:hypothetical protein
MFKISIPGWFGLPPTESWLMLEAYLFSLAAVLAIFALYYRQLMKIFEYV